MTEAARSEVNVIFSSDLIINKLIHSTQDCTSDNYSDTDHFNLLSEQELMDEDEEEQEENCYS